LFSFFAQGSRDLCRRRLPMCRSVQLYTFAIALRLKNQLLSSIQLHVLINLEACREVFGPGQVP